MCMRAESEYVFSVVNTATSIFITFNVSKVHLDIMLYQYKKDRKRKILSKKADCKKLQKKDMC